jgi:putative transposase
MSRQVSPSTNKSYGIARVLRVWELTRSSFYAARFREQHPNASPGKRGPHNLSDEQALDEIRKVLHAPLFAGEIEYCV